MISPYFTHKQYDNKVYVVTEHYGPEASHSFGIVWSRERAVVIDPGLGLSGDVRKYAESLIGYEKAIYTISTNGTPACVGGCGLFDESFIDPQDAAMAQESLTLAARMDALKAQTSDAKVLAYAGENAIDDTRCNVESFRTERILRTLDCFDHFHLGGVHIEGINVPSKTPGSMVLTVHGDDTINCCYCGDTILPGTNDLSRLDRAGLEAYCKGLANAIDHMEHDVQMTVGRKPDTWMRLFCSTTWLPFGVEVPKALLKAAQAILAGDTADDISCEGKCLKLAGEGAAAILYDPAKL